MAKILLGVTGSVAAVYTPELFDDLRGAGHDVKVVATAASLYFFDPSRLLPAEEGRRNPDVVVLDADEWPRDRYRRGERVLHIELRRWADLLLIAPLDANTLGKLALGLADNTLTCIWRAWERTRPVVLAPAMNTLMLEHPATARHLRQIAEDLGASAPASLDLPSILEWINRQAATLRILAPVSKRLACDDVGVGAMAPRDAIVAAVQSLSDD